MIDYIYFTLQNPWWEKKDAIEEDEKVKEFNGLKFQYDPKEILSIPLHSGNIYLITGPRQTGKSTALKLYIRQLLQSGFPAPAILYFNCDALSTRQEIIDLIIEFKRLNEHKQTVICLDEISSVADWTYAIKWLADSGFSKDSLFLLTGSSSINLKKSGEFMPGRRGNGKDIVFLPISFFDYLKLQKEDVNQVQINQPNLISIFWKWNDKIKKHFDKFILTGGFLRNINYGLTESTNDLYLKTLKSELFKSGKKEDRMREVIRKILHSLSSQTSYTNIAEEAELGSKNTAIDYLDFLVDSFFLQEVRFYNIKDGRVILKKNKKFYASDPYLLWLFEGFATGSLDFRGMPKLIDQSKVAENFVASELVKLELPFFFFQNSRELDFYLPEKKLGIEVKYKDRITADDMKSLEIANQKILVSKNTLEVRDSCLIVPVHLFPLLDLRS